MTEDEKEVKLVIRRIQARDGGDVEESGTRWRATDTTAVARHRHRARHKTASGARVLYSGWSAKGN